jgi:hypothetical protein
MFFDTANAARIGFALLLLALALFRAHGHKAAALPRPKHPLGFSPA